MDDSCLETYEEITANEQCDVRDEKHKFCTNYRVFKNESPSDKIGAKIGIFVPSVNKHTLWFQSRDIVLGNITKCDPNSHVRNNSLQQ